MLPPIRCPSCGKPLGHLWEEYEKRVKSGEKPEKVLNELGITRYCCRRTMISTVVVFPIVAKFKRI